jgi:hypothetical protein
VPSRARAPPIGQVYLGRTHASGPPSPQHTWADLLRLVGAIQRIAYGRSLEPDDQMRRVRDLFLAYDRPEVDDD